MCVCVCLYCVEYFSCSMINEVQVRVSVGFLSCFLGFLFVDLQNKASFSSYALVLLTWNAIAALSEEHEAKLVYRVLLLYL